MHQVVSPGTLNSLLDLENMDATQLTSYQPNIDVKSNYISTCAWGFLPELVVGILLI